MKPFANLQQGVTFVGFILIAAGIVFIAIAAMKLVPAYVHNQQIAQIFKSIAQDSEMRTASLHDIKESYTKRASINYITDITAEDIDIDKSNGQLILSANYSVKIPIVGNATLLLEFNPSSQ
jgi:hypothetical protein